jgi:hypothetical protein
MSTVSLDLLVRANGTEDNLGETASFEWAICDSSNNFEGLLDDGDGQMSSVVNKSRDVILGHFWELFLEDTFEAGQDDERFALVVVVDYSEFDFTIALFDDSGLEFIVSMYAHIHSFNVVTFSGNGIRLISGFFSGGSAESSCLMRFDGVGDDGSSSALRLPSV